MMKQTLSYIVFLLALSFAMPATAQVRTHVYMNQDGVQWDIPFVNDSLEDMSLSEDARTVYMNTRKGIVVPFNVEQMDSLTFEDEPEVETKDKYKVFTLYVTTDDGEDITSRDEYKACHIALNAKGSFTSYSASAGIRGRGNSSYLWYDKKPMRLRFDDKHKVLGLSKARSWVLLANYRDVTDMMNTFVFEAGEWLGLPFTNHTRYVELFVNGDYRGVYQLTEQVQQNKNRVAVSDERGILLSLDVDDGPGENPGATDNFTSKVYKMPACVKYPDDEAFTENTVDSVKAVFATLEQAIKDKNYAQVKELLDIPSFIKYLQLQEFVYNVELSAPRSIFLFKDGDDKWFMGPLWDFDAGYDFDWGDMYTGHTFFSNYRETVMGTNPLKRNGQYSYVPQFFTDLFGCKEFVEEYKSRWAAVKDEIVGRNWDECMKYVENLRKSGAMEREAVRWPIRGKNFETELEKMHQWLINRCNFISDLIANIPVPEETTPVTNSKFCGTMKTSVSMDWSKGFSQSNKVKVNRQTLVNLMGISMSTLKDEDLNIVPLDTDGEEGINGTNGVFGAWFDGDGNPGVFANGHVYIEVFDDLWNWNCGLYQQNCYDDEHTVTMQYQYPHNGTLLKVNVEVKFTITGSGWW